LADKTKEDEKTEQETVNEDDGIKTVVISDEAIADRIKLIDEAYKKLINALEKQGFDEISIAALSKDKKIRIVSTFETSNALRLELSINSLDNLSSNGIEILMDTLDNREGEGNGTTFIIPPEALDLEYITEYLKGVGEEVSSSTDEIETLKKRKVSVTIKKVNEEEMQEYMQALADRTKEGVAFTAASDAFDLYVMIIEAEGDGIYI
jgi:uncharacterized FlaG/YvyC family protein